MNHLTIPQRIHRDIMDSIGSVPVESGGIFAMQGNVISDYYFDIDAGSGNRFYRPSTESITRKVNAWMQEGKSFGGFIHSHSEPYITLSAMDIVAAEKTMLMNHLRSIYMAILCGGKLYLYRVSCPHGQEKSIIEACTIEVQEQ